MSSLEGGAAANEQDKTPIFLGKEGKPLATPEMIGVGQPKLIDSLAQILSPVENDQLEDLLKNKRGLIQRLEHVYLSPEWRGVKDTLTLALNSAYTTSIFEARAAYIQEHSPEAAKIDPDGYEEFLKQYVSQTYVGNVLELLDYSVILPLLADKDSPKSAEALTQRFDVRKHGYAAAAILFLLLMFFPVSAEAQDLENTPVPDTTEESAGSLNEFLDSSEVQQAQDIFEIAFKLGQEQNPVLMWPLKELAADGTVQYDNIFSYIYDIGPEDPSDPNSKYVNMALAMFDIDEVLLIEMLEGYTLGYWYPEETDVELMSNSVAIAIMADKEKLNEVCDSWADACYLGDTMYFESGDANIVERIPHEVGHDIFSSKLWNFRALENRIFAYGDVTLELSDKRSPGIILSTDTGLVGELDLGEADEALAEIVSHAAFSTTGTIPDSGIYTSSFTDLSDQNTYFAFLDGLSVDDGRRQEWESAIWEQDLMKFFTMTGEILLEQNPDYIEAVYSAQEDRPELAERYFFSFNLERYQTKELLQKLPPALQAGLLFWGEVASLTRHSETSDQTFSVTFEGGKMDYRLVPLKQIVATRDGLPPLEANDTSYQFGQATAELGAQRAQALFQEFQKTGTVVVPEGVTHQRALQAILESYFSETNGFALSEAAQTTLSKVLQEMSFTFTDEISEDQLPYMVERKDKSLHIAGRYLEDSTFSTQITTSQEKWVKDGIWASFKTLMEAETPREDYIALPSKGIDNIFFDYRDFAGQYFIGRVWIPRSEPGKVEKSLLDITGAYDILGYLMMKAVSNQPEAELVEELGPDLAEVVMRLRDEGLFSILGASEIGPLYALIDLVPKESEFDEADLESLPLYSLTNEWRRLDKVTGWMQALEAQLPWIRIKDIPVESDTLPMPEDFKSFIDPIDINRRPFDLAWEMMLLTHMNDEVEKILAEDRAKLHPNEVPTTEMNG